MARKGRVFVVTLGVIVVLIIVAAVAVRLFFTREKLVGMIVPRIERAVDAQVTIGDIGINFPFGFGVDIEDLSFRKTLPDTNELSFSSEKVTARASLMSLIRRKPEIKAADVQGGVVILSNPNKKTELQLRGLDAHGRMNPAGDGFVASAKAAIDSVLFSALGRPPAITIEKLVLDGAVEGDAALTRLVIKDSRVSWADLVTAKIEGEVANVRTAPRLALTMDGDEKPLAPVLEKIREFKLDELSSPKPRSAQAAPAKKTPAEISRGTFDFKLAVEGLVREPLGMNVSFECAVKDLAMKAGEALSIAKAEGELKGQGVVLAWQGLFPSASKPRTPAEISVAWKSVRLDGKIALEGGDFLVQSGSTAAGAARAAGETGSGASAPGDTARAAAPAPIRLSALKAKAEISGPDVTKVSGAFAIGSSPYEFEGSMLNIMPAASELLIIARNLAAAAQAAAPDPGPILDKLVNAPVVRFEVTGRSFDARPYQKSSRGAQGTAQAANAGAQPASSAKSGGAALAVLFLKNTTFSAKLDSVITREAIVTKLDAKGTIRDGRVRVEPATFVYAGGKGRAVVSSDFRAAKRVETKVDFSAEGVQAAQALSRLHSLGNLVQGAFSLKSNASATTGPGINSLMALTATGLALSSKGTVSIERFIEPLTKIQGFDVTPFKQFDFREWTGNFYVKDGRFTTDDWKIKSSRGDWAIKGSFGFNGTLDYAVHVVIPPDVQRMMKDVDKYKGIFDLMRDQSGNLVLDMKIGGTTQHPSASLDLTKVKSKVQDRVLEGLRNKLLR